MPQSQYNNSYKFLIVKDSDNGKFYEHECFDNFDIASKRLKELKKDAVICNLYSRLELFLE
jgi:hypothetical protein